MKLSLQSVFFFLAWPPCSASALPMQWIALQHTASHCNTLQHTATHCSTQQHTRLTVLLWYAAVNRMYLEKNIVRVAVCVESFALSLFTSLSLSGSLTHSLSCTLHLETRISWKSGNGRDGKKWLTRRTRLLWRGPVWMTLQWIQIDTSLAASSDSKTTSIGYYCQMNIPPSLWEQYLWTTSIIFNEIRDQSRPRGDVWCAKEQELLAQKLRCPKTTWADAFSRETMKVWHHLWHSLGTTESQIQYIISESFCDSDMCRLWLVSVTLWVDYSLVNISRSLVGITTVTPWRLSSSLIKFGLTG